MTLKIQSDDFDDPVSVTGAGIVPSAGMNVIFLPVDEDDYEKLDEETLELYDEPVIRVGLNILKTASFKDADLLDAFRDVIDHGRTYTVKMDNLLDFAKNWCNECDGYGVLEVDVTCNECGSLFMARCPECGERQDDGSLKPDYCECIHEEVAP